MLILMRRPEVVPVKKRMRPGPNVIGVSTTGGVALLGITAVHALVAVGAEGGATWAYLLAVAAVLAVGAAAALLGPVLGRRTVHPAPPGRPARSSQPPSS